MRVLNATASDPYSSMKMTLHISEQLNRLFFKQGEWNAIVRTGLKAGADHWLEAYLPLRFTDYARSALGYTSKAKSKKPGKQPLVKYGDLQDTALGQSWAEPKATAGNAYVIVHIATGMTRQDSKHAPVPYGANPIVYQTLTTITAAEVEVVAMTMEAVMKQLIDGANTTVSRKKTVRKTLTATQRTTLAPTKRTPQQATHRKAS